MKREARSVLPAVGVGSMSLISVHWKTYRSPMLVMTGEKSRSKRDPANTPKLCGNAQADRHP